MLNGNATAAISPPLSPTVEPADRALVALLKLTATADRLIASARAIPLPDRTRALVDELAAGAAEAWTVLGPEHRMAAGG